MEQQYIPKSRLFRENFLPGGVIRLRNNSYGKVIGARNNGPGLEHIDKVQLFDVIQRFVDAWENLSGGAVDEALRYALNSKSFVVQCPSQIYVSPYPLILQCTKCRVLDFYGTRQDHDKKITEITRRVRRVNGRPGVKCNVTGTWSNCRIFPYTAADQQLQ